MQVVDITEIRRRNLDVLKAEFRTLEAIGEAMRKAAPASKAGARYANVLAQCRGGKTMGNDFARRLEASVNKPKGWMDTPQFEAVEAKEAGVLAMNMPEEDRQAWLKHGRLLVQQHQTVPEDHAAEIPPQTSEPPSSRSTETHARPNRSDD